MENDPIYEKVRAAIGEKYEKRVRENLFYALDADEHLNLRADTFAKGIYEVLDSYPGDHQKFIDRIIQSIAVFHDAFGPQVAPWLAEFVEETFYEKVANGDLRLSSDAQALVDDRWPLTYVSAMLFTAYRDQDEYKDFAEFVESRKEFILNDENAPEMDEGKYYQLLGYYDDEDFEACYLFAAGYAEREFFHRTNAREARFFKRLTNQKYREVVGEWRDPLLSGLVDSVQKHWGSVLSPNEDYPQETEDPTRNSVAHGIPTGREVEAKDALQMLLILQAVPFWLQHIAEARWQLYLDD